LTILTLFVKIDNKKKLNQSKKIIQSYFENLEVEEKILGANKAGWLQLSIDGEDEKIATNYLNNKIGLIPIYKENINNNSNYKGRISNFIENKSILIDMGVVSPQISLATITLKKIQKQLMKDKKTSLKDISSLFGLIIGLPLNIKVLNIFEEETKIEAELSDVQLSLFDSWQKSFLDRLIIIGASRNQIKKTLNLTRLNKDVIDVESLGMFVQVLTCKLGTDAVGLIPRIGKILKNTKLTVFNPKKIHMILQSKPQIQY
jgi:hypothetical protein